MRVNCFTALNILPHLNDQVTLVDLANTDFYSNSFFTKGKTPPHFLHAAVLLALFIPVPFQSFHFMWFKSDETCSYNFLYQNWANKKAFNLPCIKVQATEWGNELFINPILLCHYSNGIAVGCIDHSLLYGCMLTTKCNLEGISDFKWLSRVA